ncbi:DUF4864 domain-containing protein [Maritimibacter fusiformis]|uniref:DUF4864 domain-containing protein n=1 Tax=Maritimibacter fusiformis TaxID=2603819 RepID=A0A5D0RLM8_9RHOB|nr:DUF4864 domain-containing protein [Maritimibacter fusiformis]TYB82540.1 DUF4864 domain-containing protein [Maritimibacter fusiformis]
MKQIILICAMAIALAFPINADEGEAGGIRAVITDQFAAFEADDFAAAFGLASPGIQRVFQTPESFAAMVRNGYPMVHRNAEVRFLELREVDGRLWQKVMVRDRAGALHVLDYEMIEHGGDWRIGAVQYLRQPEVGA